MSQSSPLNRASLVVSSVGGLVQDRGTAAACKGISGWPGLAFETWVIRRECSCEDKPRSQKRHLGHPLNHWSAPF
jgi:hypothetical protein